jgi:hypothetical protein
MTVIRGFLIVATSAVLCALVGLGAGWGLGVAAPGYYRTVFRLGNQPGFDPVELGIGLGLTQGLVAGLVVGCVVVLSVAWYNSRRQIIIREFEPLPLSTKSSGGSSAIQAASPESGV